MEKTIENVIMRLRINNYTPDNYSFAEEKDFFKICSDFNKEFSKICDDILTKKNIQNYSKKDQEILMSRLKSNKRLNEELENTYMIDEEGNSIGGDDTIECLKRRAIFTEICNNSAHIVENYIQKNNLKKDKKMKDLKKSLYKTKQLSIMQLVKDSKNKEAKGIISGFILDDTKSENNISFVMDIASIGQLSWHVNKAELGEEYNLIYEKNKYPFKLDKTNDKKEPILNTDLLLGDIPDYHLEVHNRLDVNIPQGHEDELELCLKIYNEVLASRKDLKEYERTSLDDYEDEKVYRRFKNACKKHGLPSKETMEVLMYDMLDQVFSDIRYDKDALRKWREKSDGKSK